MSDDRVSYGGPLSRITVLYRDQSQDDCSLLLKEFHIVGYGAVRARVKVNDVNIEVEVDPETILPEGPLSLTEKLNLRFEEAMVRTSRGEPCARVDLRFCTGGDKGRRADQDSLLRDYAFRPSF